VDFIKEPERKEQDMSPRVCIPVATICLTLLACSHSEPVGISAAVVASAATVVVSPSEATLDIGGTQQFSAQLLKDDKQKKAAFSWSSSDPSVATVSSAGLVTAVAPGEATITATEKKESGSAHVTVRRPAPPQVAKHLVLDGGPFGSAVSSAGIGWIGQPTLGRVSRLDIASGTFTGNASGGPLPVQISANADGSRIYVVSFFSHGMVSSINTGTLTTENTVFATPDPQDAYGVTNTPSGDTVFVGITNGPIFKVDMRSGTVLGTLNLPVAAGYHFEWNANRTRLYASQRAFDGGRVFEIEPNGFTLLRTFETGGAAQGIQLSADGSKLFVAAQNGGVIVWDVASNSLVTTYATPGCNGYGLLRTPDNSFLVVGCVLNGLVEVLDPTTGALIETLNVGGRPRELSWDAGTRSILVPNEGGWVDILH
jgi:WD40 repeat protein